jgi:hypothetical protein
MYSAQVPAALSPRKRRLGQKISWSVVHGEQLPQLIAG